MEGDGVVERWGEGVEGVGEGGREVRERWIRGGMGGVMGKFGGWAWRELECERGWGGSGMVSWG